MLFSLAGIIQPAKDEIEANEQLDDVWRSVWAHSYKQNLYSVNAVFEAKDLDKFLKEFNKVFDEFLQNYEER